MKHHVTWVLALGLLAWSTPSATAQQPAGTTGTQHGPTASAALVDREGREIGQAYLRETPHGVLLKLDLKNATPGTHGLHVHEVGRCDRPSFESAGGHFNPGNREHGFFSARGPHAGDLPNIVVPSSTELSVEFFVPNLKIAPGAGSLVDDDGSALVMHAGQDDYSTQPSGDSSDRLACGEIVRSAS